MNPIWLMRLSRLARNPPSRKRAILMGIVAIAVAAIWGLEALGLWPDWATAARMPRTPNP